MAAAIGKRKSDLTCIPSDFSIFYLPDQDISLKAKQQGFRFFSEGYFHDFEILIDDENTINVAGKCYRSQRKTEKPHVVHFDIEGRKISYAYCSCQAGMSGSCSHIVGLIQALHQWQLMGFTSVPAELSCTSLPQQWNAPRGKKIEPEAVSSLCFVNTKPDRKRVPVQNKITDCRKIRVVENDINFLQSLDGCAISYLVSKPPLTVNTHLGNVPVGSGISAQAQLYATERPEPVTTVCGNLKLTRHSNLQFDETCSLTQIELTEESSCRLEENTREQSDSQLWFAERKTRLTASQFGLILKRKSITNKFLGLLMEPKHFTSTPTTYGKCNERKAVSMYMTKTKNHTHKCGLLVNPKFPFWGATPDGKVCEDGSTGLLEVKCPFAARDKTIIEA